MKNECLKFKENNNTMQIKNKREKINTKKKPMLKDKSKKRKRHKKNSRGKRWNLNSKQLCFSNKLLQWMRKDKHQNLNRQVKVLTHLRNNPLTHFPLGMIVIQKEENLCLCLEGLCL